MNKHIIKKLIKFLSKIALIFVLGLLLIINSTKNAHAQVDQETLQCYGEAVADYMNTVIETATAGDGLQNIVLLSPAFNMTNDFSHTIVVSMDSAGANWGALGGMAGNSYNTSSNTVTGYVQNFLNGISGTGLAGHEIMLTEVNDFNGNHSTLGPEINTIQSSPQYIGALLFNAFGTNPDPEFEYAVMTDEVIEDDVCQGNCNRVGVNSGVFYGSENDSSNENDFYGHAESLGMDFTLSISNADQSTTDGINQAHPNLVPVIRIGTEFSPGPSAEVYGNYLASLDNQISNTVYAIAGPNEPQTECWAAASQCGCTVSQPPPSDGSNLGRRPAEEGFSLGEYECDETTDEEFHPLRPYPRSACDMLIPRSVPEAPFTADKKYNTYACGTNIVFENTEVFDPWGENDETDTITSVATGQEYEYTHCDDEGFDYEEGGLLTCYRTLRYNVTADFRDSNIGILGNTQIDSYDDETRANNYLSWYFTGPPQIGDHEVLNPNDPEDIERVIDFSGPIRKLMPQDHLNFIRLYIPWLIGEDVHNYMLEADNEGFDWRISHLNELWILRSLGFQQNTELFLNAPLSSLEDIAGEAILTAPPQGAPPVGGTAPSGMFIISAEPPSP